MGQNWLMRCRVGGTGRRRNQIHFSQQFLLRLETLMKNERHPVII